MPLAKRSTKTFWTVSFAEVVVDPVDLALLEDGPQHLVQLLRRRRDRGRTASRRRCASSPCSAAARPCSPRAVTIISDRPPGASRGRRCGCGGPRAAPRSRPTLLQLQVESPGRRSRPRGMRRLRAAPRGAPASSGVNSRAPLAQVAAELLVGVGSPRDADDGEVGERSRRRGTGARSPARAAGASDRRRRRR